MALHRGMGTEISPLNIPAICRTLQFVGQRQIAGGNHSAWSDRNAELLRGKSHTTPQNEWESERDAWPVCAEIAGMGIQESGK